MGGRGSPYYLIAHPSVLALALFKAETAINQIIAKYGQSRGRGLSPLEG